MGGLLLTPPRTSEAQGPTSATTAPKPGQTTTSRTAPDLSPRVPGAGQGNGTSAASPSPEAAQPGLADPLALDDILPPIDATGGAAPDAPPPTGASQIPTGEAAPDYGRTAHSRWPLTAGLIVTLAILFFGGGFLWWRNRDSRYWPA